LGDNAPRGLRSFVSRKTGMRDRKLDELDCESRWWKADAIYAAN
jgi:hypothetical protein